MDYQIECEGHAVRLMGEGPFRRWFCDCREFSGCGREVPYAWCRHIQIISSRLAGNPMKPDPVKPMATILSFAPKLRALQGRRQ
jgi:hypothetical protein